jgi:isopenicillin-N epimerase
LENNIRSLWCLDPKVIHLNHGSFGACPIEVLLVQSTLRTELERDPHDFFGVSFRERLDKARTALANFLKADPADLVFVTNATSGINSVLRSLHFGPGDELLTTTHAYGACRKTLDYVAAGSGANVVAAALPFPVGNDDEIVEAVLACASPRTKIAVIDHVTSPTALVLPIARLVQALQARGIDVLVDGAHAPGMVPLALCDLGAAYYTGNLHKWVCAPKGAAFLHVRRDRQSEIHPTVISHGLGAGFHNEFDWTGTCDPTPWLCVPKTISYMGSLMPKGWSEIMARNHSLAVEARRCLLEAFGVQAPCPDEMIGSMASVPMPDYDPRSVGGNMSHDELCSWIRERGVRAVFIEKPPSIVRISAHLYNSVDDFRMLASLLSEARLTPLLH